MMKSPSSSYAIFSVLAGFLGICNSTAQSAYPDPVFTSYFRQETGWQAGDGTISVPLPGGQVLWLFGDSYVDMAYMAADTSLPCLFNRRNALVIQNDANPSVLTYYTSLIPSAAGHYYWPGKGVYQDGKVYIFLLERNSGGFVGSRCAELSFPGLQVLNIHNVPNPEGIEFGKATFVDETNGWLYVYGSRLFPGFGVHRYYASRCPLSNLLQGWQYWNGSASLAARLYPNPLAHSSLQLELQSSKCSNLGVALYNLNGEQMWRRHFEGVVSGELLPLNIGKDLPPGMYTVRLRCANEQQVLRLVVQ